MKKFNVKFQREFEVGIEADDIELAQALARKILAGFPPNSTKMLSILPEGYVESASEPEKPTPPFGRPNGGGSPGTPVVKVPELVDQIAKAA